MQSNTFFVGLKKELVGLMRGVRPDAGRRFFRHSLHGLHKRCLAPDPRPRRRDQLTDGAWKLSVVVHSWARRPDPGGHARDSRVAQEGDADA